MDPEVVEIATRRQFSASEKRALVAEARRWIGKENNAGTQ
jgi:hypothetical protein